MGLLEDVRSKIVSDSQRLEEILTDIKNKKGVFGWRERRKLSKFIGLFGAVRKSKKDSELIGIVEEIVEDYAKIREALYSKKWLLGFDKKGDPSEKIVDFFHSLDSLVNSLKNSAGELARQSNVLGRRQALSKMAEAAAGIALGASAVGNTASAQTKKHLPSESSTPTQILKQELNREIMFEGFPRLVEYANIEKIKNAILYAKSIFDFEYESPSESVYLEKEELFIEQKITSVKQVAEKEVSDKVEAFLKAPNTLTKLLKIYHESGVLFDNSLRENLRQILIDGCMSLEGYSGPLTLKEMDFFDKSQLLVNMFNKIFVFHERRSIGDQSSFYGLIKEGKGDCDTIALLFVMLGELLNLPITMIDIPKHAFIMWKSKYDTEPFYFDTRNGKPYINNPNEPLAVTFNGIDELYNGLKLCNLFVDYMKKRVVSMESERASKEDQIKTKEIIKKIVECLPRFSQVIGSRKFNPAPISEKSDYYGLSNNPADAYNFHHFYIDKPFICGILFEIENYEELKKEGYFLIPLQEDFLLSFMYYDAASALLQDVDIGNESEAFNFAENNPQKMLLSVRLMEKSFHMRPRFILARRAFVLFGSIYLHVNYDQMLDQKVRETLSWLTNIMPSSTQQFNSIYTRIVRRK